MTVLPLRTVLPTLVHDRWDETGCRPVVAGIPAGADRPTSAAAAAAIMVTEPAGIELAHEAADWSPADSGASWR
jgi:hypothetical protein